MKTSDLTGAQLDYWVAKASGFILTRSEYGDKPAIWDTGGGFYRVDGPAGNLGDERWRPSTWWGHGGPIIDRDRITLKPQEEEVGPWYAKLYIFTPGCIMEHEGRGRTALVAAMRAKVRSMFGDTVEDVQNTAEPAEAAPAPGEKTGWRFEIFAGDGTLLADCWNVPEGGFGKYTPIATGTAARVRMTSPAGTVLEGTVGNDSLALLKLRSTALYSSNFELALTAPRMVRV